MSVTAEPRPKCVLLNQARNAEQLQQDLADRSSSSSSYDTMGGAHEQSQF